MIDLIAFDADDTLWHNENLYAQGVERFNRLLSKYPVKGPVHARQQEIEIQNLRYFGYGVAGFVFSLIEAAIELTEGKIQAADIQDLIQLSKEMFSAEVELFDHAEPVLAALSQTYPLILITKGDLRHQQDKVARSGLQQYFRRIEVVSDKTPEIYSAIIDSYQVPPSRFMMVGDSLRSDIDPVLALGGWAVHIPNHTAWAHEHATIQKDNTPRLFELEHLGQLPDLLRQIDALVPRSA